MIYSSAAGAGITAGCQQWKVPHFTLSIFKQWWLRQHLNTCLLHTIEEEKVDRKCKIYLILIVDVFYLSNCITPLATLFLATGLTALSNLSLSRPSICSPKCHLQRQRDKRVPGVVRPHGNRWQEGRALQHPVQTSAARRERPGGVRTQCSIPAAPLGPVKQLGDGGRSAVAHQLQLPSGGCQRRVRLG